MTKFEALKASLKDYPQQERDYAKCVLALFCKRANNILKNMEDEKDEV